VYSQTLTGPALAPNVAQDSPSLQEAFFAQGSAGLASVNGQV